MAARNVRDAAGAKMFKQVLLSAQSIGANEWDAERKRAAHVFNRYAARQYHEAWTTDEHERQRGL
jgi:hypothetical protein